MPNIIKPCIKCGAKDRYSNNQCRPCKIKQIYQYRIDNPEKFKATQNKYHKKVIDRKKEYAKKYRIENKEKIKKWHDENKERRAENCRRWVKLNPIRAAELWKAGFHKRRALEIGSGGRLSKGLFEKLFALQRGKCPVCKVELSNKKPRSPMDHIVALVNGGKNEDLNIQILCQPCNQKKHRKHPVDFMQSMGFLL